MTGAAMTADEAVRHMEDLAADVREHSHAAQRAAYASRAHAENAFVMLCICVVGAYVAYRAAQEIGAYLKEKAA